MATATEALEKMREICLALPNTREGNHFGDVMFYAGTRPFASCGAKEGPCTIIFQLEPAHTEGLLATDGRFTRYARDKRAIVLDATNVTSWDEVNALIQESYDLVTKPKPKPTKKKVAVAKKKTAKKKTAKKKTAKKKTAKKKKNANRARAVRDRS